MTRRSGVLGVVVAAVLGACGGGDGGTQPPVNCNSVAPTTLAVGASSVIDPASAGGCLVLPAAGAGGAEYLVVALSSNGVETSTGISGTYTLSASTAATAAPPAALARGAAPRAPDEAEAFHLRLRQMEKGLAQTAGASPAAAPPVATVPPALGSKRTFKVCATTACTSFVDVTATAKYVGAKGAVYLDDVVPPNGYTQSDLDSVGVLFDTEMYPIDTTAFGRESDLDQNQVVIILLTDQVNALTPTCNQTGAVILGYFFGLDLLPSRANSNGGEIFYGLVPDPANTSCTISKVFVRRTLAPTFIHEFQHMISFNQHVLLRGGLSEDVWLNEGLSHFAEELGGRLIPDPWCVGGDCLSQFGFGNFDNAFSYLSSPEDHFLVVPGSSNGTLEERGADWLFVRWVLDQFAQDTILGTNLTRQLEQTADLGYQNVQNRTGQSFSTLVTQWQLANYAEQLAGFPDPTGRLRYKSWDLETQFSLCCGPYPLNPDVSSSGSYSRTGTLRAGSGRHVRFIQGANAGPIQIQLTTGNTAQVAPRYGLVRIQ